MFKNQKKKNLWKRGAIKRNTSQESLKIIIPAKKMWSDFGEKKEEQN